MRWKERLEALRDYLFPGEAERDPGFRAEVERLSLRALRTIGWINLIMPATGAIVHVTAQILEPVEHRNVYSWSVALFFLLGGTTLLIARSEWARRRARLLTLANGFLSGAILVWVGLFGARAESAEITSLLNVVVVLLVGVALVPALPWQILLLGGALGWLHFFSAGLSADWGWTPPVSLHHYAGLDMIILLCTALAAVNYRKVHETYTSHRGEIEAQERLLVTENAAMLGKFAATISHELNSPLGAVGSSLDSLERLETRRARGEAADNDRTRGLHETLVQTALTSLGSMRQAVGRMQRFTNLDRTEAHSIDMRQLLSDVKALLEPEWEGRVVLEIACGELPRLTVRPQQISAVLAKLLQNAIHASPPEGMVELAANCRNGAVEVTIRDEGPGFGQAELETLFEPGFRVRDGRVTAGHWGLFSSRQVVREHGGELRVQSAPGQGAVVTMTLPRDSPFEPPSTG
jgi:signal transduction histidine kinase